MQFTTFTSFNVLLGLCTLFAVVSADFAQINAAVLEIDQRATGLKESLLNTDGSVSRSSEVRMTRWMTDAALAVLYALHTHAELLQRDL